MDKLKLIIIREYLAKVRNRSFIIMTVLSPVLIAALIAFVVFLIQMNRDEKKVIALLNESALFTEDFKNTGSISFIELKGLELEKAKDSVSGLGYHGLLHIPDRLDFDTTTQNIELYTEASASIMVLSALEDRISRRVREEKLKKYGVSKDQMDDISENYELKNASFSGKENLKGTNEIRSGIGAAFGYLIMMFIIIYGAFVMRSVIEEKTSRIIEVIISSVKPFQLMLGKIIGTSLAGITQFVIWIVSAGLLVIAFFAILGVDMTAYMGGTSIPPETMETIKDTSASKEKIEIFAREIINIPWTTLIISFILYFILGYLIYSSIYAAIGAAVDNETDTQQFMLPVILPMILAVYVGFFSVFSNPHGPIAVGFSLFPLTSPIVMLMRIPSETPVPTWQIILSIALLVATFTFMVWFAGKIYRVGILMYGKKASYKDLYRWLKYS